MSTVRAEFHASFSDVCDEDSDLVLQSSDGTLYRVPEFILPPTAFAPSPAVIPVDSPDEILLPALLLLSGLPVPPFPGLDVFARMVKLLQSWRAPLGTLKSFAQSPLFLEEPLELYTLAYKCGWAEAAALAARKTLKLDLYDPVHAKVLESMPTGALVRLFQFHRARRELFKKELGDGFNECCGPCGARTVGGEWRALMARMTAEIEKGNEESVCSLEMEEWYECECCWGLKCKECDEFVYDRLETLQRIRMAANALPEIEL
ncbi:hypothetical protein CYLTODRAFT_417162 [Cylindrobasidium torrendii FP15055 ss-10]|uniref:BTB domain-containing protein n=1 Tax=Cylindrobasidium torrendii FP15055 ss-10 TaxID=1314674 RepID=A0A0D7BRP1_9AGAR|nr:hypothetical protein CYLTODRAFT_417162 [Cylindrobasidium torrendii FP15055 ss-10]